jgi:23S rRNA pseudouridine1911/1915/1917 synthase
MTAQTEQRLLATIPDECDGLRLDQALARLFSDYSRARLQQWVREGQVRVDERVLRPRDKVSCGQRVEVYARLSEPGPWQPEDLPLDIEYQDEDILVVHKQAGQVVHPAAGNWEGTLVNALLHFDPGLAHLPRAGIVHRLDKDTSGLLVVARNAAGHKHLVEQLQARAFHREYIAIVQGVMTAGGRIEAPIGRHPVQRKRMAVVNNGKPAVTHYRVMARFRAHTEVRVTLETGRTHQIRVHMAYIGYPLLGDPLYGGRLKIAAGTSETLAQALRQFKRQALHAAALGLRHPASGEWMQWQRPLPEDMQRLIEVLQRDLEEVTP